MSCKDCNKYTVSCSVLEGFECCKCCNILECKYDICPSNEKIIKNGNRTQYEYSWSAEISHLYGEIQNAKEAFLERRFDIHYFNNVKHAYDKFKEFKKDIKTNKKIRPHMKKIFIKRIDLGLLCCKDLDRQIKYALNKQRKKKSTYNYFKRNLKKFSAKAIGKNKILSRFEKTKLIRKKGINNPWIYIHY